MALVNYLEAEEDGHGPVPMEVGAMKGKKGDKSKMVTAKESTVRALQNTTRTTSTARTTSAAKAVKKEKKKGKAKEKDKEKTISQHQFEFPGLLQVMWQVGAQGERVLARLRASHGGSSEFFPEFSGAECSDHICGCEDSSVYSRDQ